jgi:hypothetical protein
MTGYESQPVSTGPGLGRNPDDTSSLAVRLARRKYRLLSSWIQIEALIFNREDSCVRAEAGASDSDLYQRASQQARKREPCRERDPHGGGSNNLCQDPLTRRQNGSTTIDKTTQQEIEAGLASVIDALPDAELARLSKHLSGDASTFSR